MDYDVQPTLELLRTVLPSPRWDTTAFLDWVYGQNPDGEVVALDVDDEHRRLCHIGGVPIRLRNRDLEGRFLLLLNSSAAPEAQGTGVYVKSLFSLADKARSLGYTGVLGVTNARSTGPAVRGFKATVLGPLPALGIVPFSPGHGVRSYVCTPEFLASDEFASLTADLDDVPANGFVRQWSTDELRWRLATPGSTYSLHVTDELVAVTTRTTVYRTPFAVIMKLLPRDRRRGPLAPDRIIGAACRHHRAPFGLYVGYNANVPVPGLRIAAERLPAPLNLLVMSIVPELPDDDFVFETFEFLDFDAY